MVHIHLDEDDATALFEAIEVYLSDLRDEIAHTERLAFREELKTRQRSLKNVLEQLRIPVAV